MRGGLSLAATRWRQKRIRRTRVSCESQRTNGSSVTCAAINEPSRGVHVILTNQLPTFLKLVWGCLPRHIEDLVARADVFLRVLMTIEAPAHVESLRFARQRHLIDSPMAVRAADSLRHVHAVVEVDEAGQIIYPNPFQRLASGETFPE